MKKGSPVIIILIAVIIVVIVSLLPLSKWSGGRIKDFSLFSDILKEVGIMEGEPSYATAENIDPELLKAAAEAEKEAEKAPLPGEPIDTIISPVKPSRVGDLVRVEDYTTLGTGFTNDDEAIKTFVADFQDAYGGEGVGYVNMHSDFPGFRRSVKQGGSGWQSFSANKKSDKKYLDLTEQYFTPKGTAVSTYAGTSAFKHTGSWFTFSFHFA